MFSLFTYQTHKALKLYNINLWRYKENTVTHLVGTPATKAHEHL